MVVQTCEPGHFSSCVLVFSALDASIAGNFLLLNPCSIPTGDVEEAFAKADIAVFSNAKNHRMDSSVPILIPYVNSAQIDIIPKQREERGYKKGYIVTNANCSTTGNFRLRFLRSD
jgi:aspartate-semialdehyde dehydrogenase